MKLPIKICSLRNLIFLGYFFTVFFYVLINGSYIEAYEAFISAFSSGTYINISSDFAFFDVNMLILPIISWINAFFPGIQLYGWIVFVISLFSIYALYITFYDVLCEINTRLATKYIAILSLLILLAPNLFFLSTTRNVVVLFFAVNLRFYLLKRMGVFTYVFAFIILSILRVDAVVFLSAGLFFLLILYYRKINFFFSYPLLVSLFIYCLLNFAIHFKANDGIKSFYFHEIEVLDKENYRFENLEKSDYTQLKYFASHRIMNDRLFDVEFYSRIAKTDHSHITNSLLNFSLIVQTFNFSIEEILLSIELIIVAAVFLVLIFVLCTLKTRMYFACILLLIYPVFACTYISLPQRFLYPYYAITILIYMIILIRYTLKPFYFYFLMFLLICYAVLMNINKNLIAYSKINLLFDRTEALLDKHKGKELFIENFVSPRFNYFCPDIRYRYNQNSFYFVNLFYFQAYSSYRKMWQEKCKCNQLNLYEKLNYISNCNSVFMIGEELKKEYENYFIEEYSKRIQFIPIDKEASSFYRIKIYDI